MSVHSNAASPSGANQSAQVKAIAITAISLVLVFVFTALVNIRLPFAPNGGLIHLGNLPLFVAAILFGKRTGMIAGGIGMALFDLMSGWTLWAPFTLVIVGCMGLVVGAIAEKHQTFPLLSPGPGSRLRHQDCGVLLRRGHHLRQPHRPHHFHPRQPHPGGGGRCDHFGDYSPPPPGGRTHRAAQIIAASPPFCAPFFRENPAILASFCSPPFFDFHLSPSKEFVGWR